MIRLAEWTRFSREASSRSGGRRGASGLTLREVLIAVGVLGVLLLMVFAWALYLLSRPADTQMLGNMKQLHLATQQMALDGVDTTNSTLGWPGNTGGTFTNWAHSLVGEGYLTTNGFCKLLSGPGRVTTPGLVPRANTNAALVYNVREDSARNVVFLTSANFTNTPIGGLPLARDAKPYGKTGFVLFYKAGDGAILMGDQTGPAHTKEIGGYAPLLR